MGVSAMSEMKHGVAWTDDLLMGNEQVDSQHRRLFELVSELVVSCMDGSDSENIQKTLDFLVNYTVQHFHDEERLQVQCGYPDYFRHKQAHDDFKATVGVLVQKYTESGSSTDLSNDINKIVVRWLISHIQREDKKIGEHIRRLSARKR
jgi:hemerythrin